jgi:hypothetical protein
MRQLGSWRTWAAIGLLVVLISIGAFAFGNRSDSSDLGNGLQPSVRRVETVASVMEIRSGESFTVIDGLTSGSATLTLDDGRVVNIAPGTPGELDCADVAAPAGCVLVADMLGQAVVWFALVAANDTTSRILELPTLIDMVDGGDTGVLDNGWHVPLTNGVVRTCAGQPRSPTLRSFIESYSSMGIRTLLDLDRDEVVEVICEK